MGEYGPGISFGQACMMDKERIIHAFNGELMVGEQIGADGNGYFLYQAANKEECLEYILGAYDNAVFQAKQSMDCGRAIERLFEEVTGHSMSEHLGRYIAMAEEEHAKYQDYHYESDKPDLTVLKGEKEE